MTIQRYAPNFIDLKYPDQVMLPLGSGDYVAYADILKWAQDQYDDCRDGQIKYDRGSIIHASYMNQGFAFGQLLNYLGDRS